MIVAIHNHYNMYSLNKIFFVLLAAILMSGCRTAKPTAVSEASTDSLAISANTSLFISHDSVIILEKTGMMTDEKVEFVEEGGYVFVSADGILSMAGVAAVRSSRLKSYGRKEVAESLDMQAQSNDSVVAANRETSYIETKPKVSTASNGRKMKLAALVLLCIVIIILISKLNRNLIFND